MATLKKGNDGPPGGGEPFAQAFRRTLQYMAEAGVEGFDLSEDAVGRVRQWGGHGEANGPAAAHPFEKESLWDIQVDLGDCTRCRLHETRRNIVFGAGNPNARLMFIGEGPGAEEDRAGEPFVGAAGRLLTKIIEATRHTRSDVYIANVVKCRPPGNRNPEPEEIRACYPFLVRQVAAIGPEFICALGKVAAQTLLETRIPISKLRGRFQPFLGAQLMPTYHPAALLRNPSLKRDVWEDMKALMDAMGIERA